MTQLLVAKMNPEARLPTRKHPEDAGLDFYSCELRIIDPLSYGIVHTGIAVAIPAGMVGLIWPKSRSDFLIGGGVIDAGYRGEILVKIFNPTKKTVVIHDQDAICQMVIQPILTPLMKEIPFYMLSEDVTSRGATGGIVEQVLNTDGDYKVDEFNLLAENTEPGMETHPGIDLN